MTLQPNAIGTRSAIQPGWTIQRIPTELSEVSLVGPPPEAACVPGTIYTNNHRKIVLQHDEYIHVTYYA